MVSIAIPGDETVNEVVLDNGMKIITDYGEKVKTDFEEFDTFGTESKYRGKMCRVRLFSSDGELISSSISENKWKHDEKMRAYISAMVERQMKSGFL